MPSRKRHIVAIDLDGTLIESAWPAMGNWKPGAVDAIRTFQQRGYVVVVFTIRISPYWLDGTIRDKAEVAAEIGKVRALLDTAGLSSVSIWTKEGKPPYSILIDDKAIAFPVPGTARSWQRITEKVLVSLGADDPLYEDGDWGWEVDANESLAPSGS